MALSVQSKCGSAHVSVSDAKLQFHVTACVAHDAQVMGTHCEENLLDERGRDMTLE